ncbi:type VII secretion target [Saccharopolyspora sp. 7B]|uniref:type VII secretion target n=1 Tax=Saccharopolyspora sp. 7B TaxID=2877240 RepID=UPI0027E09CE9|nr:type VII secretion target [Saccharopolyspora sp. 7B]
MVYEVVSEDLTAHAAHLDALTDRIDTAISAAEQVSMSDEAYGLLCSFLPPIINPTEQEGIAALQAAREGIETTAQNVRTSAEEYDTNDEDDSQSFQKLHGTVPEGSEQFQLLSGGAGPTGQQQGTLPGGASEQQQGNVTHRVFPAAAGNSVGRHDRAAAGNRAPPDRAGPSPDGDERSARRAGADSGRPGAFAAGARHHPADRPGDDAVAPPRRGRAARTSSSSTSEGRTCPDQRASPHSAATRTTRNGASKTG